MKKNYLTLLIIFLLAFYLISCSRKEAGDKVYFGLSYDKTPEGIVLSKFKKDFKFKPHIVSWVMDWEDIFPSDISVSLLNWGSIPMIIWEPWVWQEENSIDFNDIINGDWNLYIKKWAQSIRDYQYPVFIQPAPDFINNKYPWSIKAETQTPEKFVKGWKKIVDIFKENNANNAIWVWSFNIDDIRDEDFSEVQACYPGDDYIDWIGLNYMSKEKSSTSDIDNDLSLPLRKITELYPEKPVMLSISEIIPYKIISSQKEIKAVLLPGKNQLSDNRNKKEQLKSFLKNRLFKADLDLLNTVHIKKSP